MAFGTSFQMCWRIRGGRKRRSHGVENQPPPQGAAAVDECASFDPSLRLSMSDVIAATGNFSNKNIIGDGGFGLVYKAELPDGRNLAVKKLRPDAFQGFIEFRSELEILGKLRHRNLLRLLGYCLSGAYKVLIYEFFEKGNLDFSLHSSVIPLSWEARFKIVLGVANGLAYLHGLDGPIVHRDMGAHNILLGPDFEARIDGFGLARTIEPMRSHVTTITAAMTSYMPPEYKSGYCLATVKGDVYSFGVLMLEVATGKQSNLIIDVNREKGLVNYARVMAFRGREMEMLDSSLRVLDLGAGLDEGKIKEYFRVALMCANYMAKERPFMSNVVQLLEQNCV